MRNDMLEKIKTLYPKSKVEFHVDIEANGFMRRVCDYWENCGPVKLWINQPVYIIISLFLMTWLYRIAFTAATQYTCFVVAKKIYAYPEIRTSSSTQILRPCNDVNIKTSQVPMQYKDWCRKQPKPS